MSDVYTAVEARDLSFDGDLESITWARFVATAEEFERAAQDSRRFSAALAASDAARRAAVAEARELGRREGSTVEGGNYARAIGLVESALGITGAGPLEKTVAAVEKLFADKLVADAKLVVEVARRRELEAQLHERSHAAELACECPDPDCDCPGCSMARDESRRR